METAQTMAAPDYGLPTPATATLGLSALTSFAQEKQRVGQQRQQENKPQFTLPPPQGAFDQRHGGPSSWLPSLPSSGGPVPSSQGLKRDENLTRSGPSVTCEEERTRQEQERTRQEQERTQQERLRLEQRRVEFEILQTSLQSGIPPAHVPMIFASMCTASNRNSPLAAPEMAWDFADRGAKKTVNPERQYDTPPQSLALAPYQERQKMQETGQPSPSIYFHHWQPPQPAQNDIGKGLDQRGAWSWSGDQPSKKKASIRGHGSYGDQQSQSLTASSSARNPAPQRESIPVDFKSDSPTGSRNGSSVTTPTSSISFEDISGETRWLEQKKAAVIDSIMSTIHKWLETWQTRREHDNGRLVLPSGSRAQVPCDGEGADSNYSGVADFGRDVCGKALPTTGSTGGNVTRKRQADRQGESGQEGHSDGDEHPSDRDTSESKGPKRKKTDQRKLACPFFKHDPSKYRDWRTCPGPGWCDAHRVKEHIFRRHRLPRFRCPRCRDVFQDVAALEDHQRADSPCIKRDKLHEEGINADQEKALRRRNGGSSNSAKTEEEKWTAIFRVLFPDAIIPSPYYDPTSDDLEAAKSSMLSEYGEFIRRELPPLVRRNLESILDFEIQETLRDRIVDIVRNLERELSSAFRHSRSSLAEQSYGGSSQMPSLEPPVTAKSGCEENEKLPSLPPPRDNPQAAFPQLELSGFLDNFDGEIWLEDADYTGLYLMLDQSAKGAHADFGSNTQPEDQPASDAWLKSRHQ